MRPVLIATRTPTLADALAGFAADGAA